MTGDASIGIVDDARNRVFEACETLAQSAGHVLGVMFEPLVGFTAVMQHRFFEYPEPIAKRLMHTIGMRADGDDRLARRRCEALLQGAGVLVHRGDGALGSRGEGLFERAHMRRKRARGLLRRCRELVLQRRGIARQRRDRLLGGGRELLVHGSHIVRKCGDSLLRRSGELLVQRARMRNERRGSISNCRRKTRMHLVGMRLEIEAQALLCIGQQAAEAIARLGERFVRMIDRVVDTVAGLGQARRDVVAMADDGFGEMVADFFEPLRDTRAARLEIGEEFLRPSSAAAYRFQQCDRQASGRHRRRQR